MAITVAATGSGRERAFMRIAGPQKGDSECVDFIERGWALGGLYSRGGALCGLYRQGWGTVWTL